MNGVRAFTRVAVYLLCSAALFAQTDGRPVMSVLGFTSDEALKAEVEVFVDYFSTHIVETGDYRVIDRAQRGRILEEIEFSYADCTDAECQLEIGRLLSADLIVVGSIGMVSNEYLLNVKLIGVETGETVNAASGKYRSMKELVEGSREVAQRLVLRTPVLIKHRLFWGEYYVYKGQEFRRKWLSNYVPFLEVLNRGPQASERVKSMISEHKDRRGKLLAVFIASLAIESAAFTVAYTRYLLDLDERQERILTGVTGVVSTVAVAVNMISSLFLRDPPTDIVQAFNDDMAREGPMRQR